MADKIRVGIIGAGRIGRLHAENLVYRLPGAEVVVVADVVEASAKACAAALGIPRFTVNAGDVTGDPAVDAVLICSSTDTHSDLIQEAAAAGKHIFCEKPIDFDLHRIDAALKAVDGAGVRLQIGFNRRFDHNFKRVREAVASGLIGKPYILRITSRDPAPPPLAYVKVSGGIFLDMTIHDFDMARFLMGSEVAEVYAVADCLVDPAIGRAGDFDTAVTSLRFENGAVGIIDNCRRSVFGYDQRAEVLGSEGMINTENDRPNTARLSTAKNVSEDPPLNFFLERYTQSYVDELAAFIDSVRRGTPSPVDGRDGRMPVVLGKAARISVEQKRPVRPEEVA